MKWFGKKMRDYFWLSILCRLFEWSGKHRAISCIVVDQIEKRMIGTEYRRFDYNERWTTHCHPHGFGTRKRKQEFRNKWQCINFIWEWEWKERRKKCWSWSHQSLHHQIPLDCEWPFWIDPLVLPVNGERWYETQEQLLSNLRPKSCN